MMSPGWGLRARIQKCGSEPLVCWILFSLNGALLDAHGGWTGPVRVVVWTRLVAFFPRSANDDLLEAYPERTCGASRSRSGPPMPPILDHSVAVIQMVSNYCLLYEGEAYNESVRFFMDAKEWFLSRHMSEFECPLV
jgi:hypothetical protein